jgi:hypothetical protein
MTSSGTSDDQKREAAAALEELPDDQPEDIRAKELAFRRHEQTEEYRLKKQLADAWCAAFVIKKQFREPSREDSVSDITHGRLNKLADGRPLTTDLAAEVERLSDQYEFFHWHLAFPEVFAKGGFDCVLGNPPWERIKLEEQQWFSERRPDIANAPDATTRRRLVEALRDDDPSLFKKFSEAVRAAEGEGHLMRDSGLYPLGSRGDINLYAVFGERMRGLLRPAGHVGAILPTGIATDDTTKYFFDSLFTTNALVSLFDFSNKEGLFPAVRRHQQFCLITMRCATREPLPAKFAFFLTDVGQLGDPSRVFKLSASDVGLVNPNTPATRSCPSSGARSRTRKSACAVSPRNSRGCSTFWGATPRPQSAALLVRVRRSSPRPRRRTPPGVDCARCSSATIAR